MESRLHLRTEVPLGKRGPTAVRILDGWEYDPHMSSSARIVSVGLSPVWQHILEFNEFRPGEVNRAARSTWCASGKSLNVALGILHLGGQVVSVCHAGGPTGDCVKQEFASLGIEAHWIETISPTRVCTTLLDRSQGTSTELVENQPQLTEDELSQLKQTSLEKIDGADYCVLSGSLPAGCPASFYGRLMLAARDSGVQFLIDARGPELLACMPLRPLLVKPNRDELARTLGRAFVSDEDMIAGMKELNFGGAQWVVVTNGSQPVFVTSLDETYCLPIVPAPRLINPIACGDALTAGIAWSLSQGRPMLDSIHIGLHCASQNAGELLPCRLKAESIPTSPPAPGN